MKKTIIQELIDEIVEHLTYDDDLSDDSRMTLETIRLRCLGKLAVEKEQIIDAHTEGYVIGGGNGDLYNCKQYYNETYESKGSDAKDVVLGYKTSLDAQMLDKIKLKQETLEEAFDRIFDSIDFTEFDFASFAIGAKWQQQNSYSEEEVLDLLNYLGKDNQDLYDWFEQFKKK